MIANRLSALEKRLLFSSINYDPKTGIFSYKTNSSSNHKRIGKQAGSFYKQKYLRITLRKKRFQAHRLAFVLMRVPLSYKCEVDHINRNKIDNRWCNLRKATRRLNMSNRDIQKNNTSGTCGVIWNRFQNKWVAYYRKKHIGYFKTKTMAIRARFIKEKQDFTYGI